MSGGTYADIRSEADQAHRQRVDLYKRLSQARNGKAIVTFFISFAPDRGGILVQEDADMLEEVLNTIDTSKGVSLFLDAPGGDGLAAERIIKICRSYANGYFETIVPSRSKSAATMVCLGADQIVMSPTSELGPIDPQVPYDYGDGYGWVAAHRIVKSYEELFDEAKNLTAGRIEPYLQQLEKFDAVRIEDLRQASELSQSIAVSSLSSGMMKGKTEAEIREAIKPFTDPEISRSHGRGIFSDQAVGCGLNVEEVDPTSDLWSTIWSLYRRCKHVVDARVSKLIETEEDSYSSL